MDSEKNKIASPSFVGIHHLQWDNDIEAIRSVKFRDLPIILFEERCDGYIEPSPFMIPKEVIPLTDSISPLVWCNNEEKEDDEYFYCYVCFGSLDYTNGYYSLLFKGKSQENMYFHKVCLEPIKNNPYHSKHSLQILIFEPENIAKKCCCCNRQKVCNFYCSICNFIICRDCVKKPLLLTVDHKKRHEHTLSYFPREVSMTCDVCGLDERRYFIYVCLQCSFVTHKECVYSPWVIKISRHEHRLSFVSLFFIEKLYCGVCRKKVDKNYGGYSCVKDCGYVAHSRCSLDRNIWDGKELEEEPDEVYENILPYKEIAPGIIQYVSHKHQMILHKEIDEMIRYNTKCQACVFPVHHGDIFSCMKCDFILHKRCVNLELKKQHVMHPHPLFLLQEENYFYCSACKRQSNGFKYKCQIASCKFCLDVNCTAISEPLDHHCHPHLLYLSSEPGYLKTCSICHNEITLNFECGECDFILCCSCASLPKEFWYKYDEHPLRILYEHDVNGQYWCDVCEKEIYLKNGIYMCKVCNTTIHIKCLLGMDMYMLPGKTILFDEEEADIPPEIDILPNNHFTRDICKECNKHCQNNIIFKIRSNNDICCSWRCLYRMISEYESDSDSISNDFVLESN